MHSDFIFGQFQLLLFTFCFRSHEKCSVIDVVLVFEILPKTLHFNWIIIDNESGTILLPIKSKKKKKIMQNLLIFCPMMAYVFWTRL